ncbi:putative Peroxidasin-like protein [Hypsibius exemplaris]|uniref:Peroxidasin-like protein n=1 Tax=Hypsibius exemplaris TaxID=2072580 RepID=A0A1W0XF91_HYPEX|nr:putative Peroxidasin-like protein [Hypsibius exemplaris]
MAEIVDGGRPDKILFDKAQPQQDWFSTTIQTGEFSVCQKRRGRKPDNEWIIIKADILIDANETAIIRKNLAVWSAQRHFQANLRILSYRARKLNRCNLHIGLQTLHTIFLRHHNNIVTDLSRMPENANWNDEKLYQEARAIIAAQLQHITFNVGHSMVQGHLPRLNENFQEIGGVPLRSTFFKASQFYKEGIVDELIFPSNFFRILKPSSLVSINIQRGRDHGIPGYMQWRKFCNLPTANSFAALKGLKAMPDAVVDKLQKVYATVEDIDFYVAGLSEERIKPDGIIGETMGCIIAEQFARLRSGDRFWYDNDLPLPSRLSNEQLAAIRRTSMSSILCSTALSMNGIQPRAFETTNQIGNDRIDCSRIPTLDLEPWRGV